MAWAAGVLGPFQLEDIDSITMAGQPTGPRLLSLTSPVDTACDTAVAARLATEAECDTGRNVARTQRPSNRLSGFERASEGKRKASNRS